MWGIEIEGGWTGAPLGFTGCDDRSVSELHSRYRYTEMVLSKPVLSINQLKKCVLKACKSYYRESNDTCGTHIHWSPVHYHKYFRPEFPKYFVKEYKRFFERDYRFLVRLSNKYCSGIITINDMCNQVRSKTNQCFNSSARYKAVNYPFMAHKTIEFRVFPALNPRQVGEDITKICNFLELVISSFGKWHRTRPLRISETMELDADGVEEQFVEV